MGQDVSSEVAGMISGAKVFGSSDNIRHGKYKFLIKRIFAELVETDAGKHRMAFWELTPIESLPNPQIEGDHVDYPGAAGPLKDDGTKPNAVGSNCALKVDFDGPGARSAGSNIKAPTLALFNRHDGEVSDDEINKTWIDLSRRKDLKVNDAIGIDPATNQPILAKEARPANPACGMVINCTTVAKRKKTANDKGAYVTKLVWTCASPIGTGENAPELVAKRRAEILANQSDDDEEVTAPPANGVQPYAQPQAVAAPVQPPAPPPPAPSVPDVAAFTPQVPFVKHPTAAPGVTPETRWYWSDPKLGGNNSIKNEAQLRSGQ